MVKLKEKLKDNKYVFLFLFIFFLVILFCCMNTFIISDDLPYSFYLHNGVRIKNITQIINNQIYDYSHYNSRVLIHAITQILLIKGKSVWNILNPLVIIFGLYYLSKIIKLKCNDSYNNLFYIIGCSIIFLLLVERKMLIYWVAGSINYTWVFTILIIYCYFYLKNDSIYDNIVCNSFAILFFSMLHECTMVMMVVFVIGNIIIEYLKNKTINKKSIFFVLALMIGVLFTLLSPGNQYRQTMNADWNSLSLISKISKTIPVVSYNLFKFNSIYCLIPVLFLIAVLTNLIKNKTKESKILLLLTLLICIFAIFLNNYWLYFVLAILLFISSTQLYIKEKDYKMIVLMLMFYANGFFMILTSEYSYGRPNYHTHLFMGLYFLITLFNYRKFKNAVKILLIIIVVFLMGLEMFIYYQIGVVSKQRKNAIEDVKNGTTDTLKFENNKFKCSMYHIDCNAPDSEDYWAYKLYLKYYGLDKDTKIEVIE